MSEARTSVRPATALGGILVAVGLAVFAVRLLHAGPYAAPSGTNLYAAIAALLLGIVLLWAAAPRALRRLAFALSPIVLFFGLYSTFAEFEEVVSIYATDSAGRPSELRLWIVDRDDGEWVGMSKAKAIEHSLDGARVEMLRKGEVRCVVPVLHIDRETVRDIHSRKVQKYVVAQGAAALGIYPREARDTAAALRLDPCPPS